MADDGGIFYFFRLLYFLPCYFGSREDAYNEHKNVHEKINR